MLLCTTATSVRLYPVAYATVHWVSPPVNEIWDQGKSLEIPVRLLQHPETTSSLNICYTNMARGDYGMQITFRNGRKRAFPYKFDGQEQSFTLRKHDTSSDQESGGYSSEALRQFIMKCQTHEQLREGSLVLAKTFHFNSYFSFFENVDIEVGDVIYNRFTIDKDSLMLAITHQDSTGVKKSRWQRSANLAASHATLPWITFGSRG